ncbi:hypothetical protein [Vulgatibacter incomptus]|uniref:Uncharacterized protein n=1 Tax=Vulgatibacter incomptus TaxID=1391653 RepID=A0A0K1PBV4_9BACT|nr:hypothetical protein [Vulgatibacter incomptus]AKU91005.1 hypothetical protein AKJ08_1392 [Vulgatibacter incomptus]
MSAVRRASDEAFVRGRRLVLDVVDDLRTRDRFFRIKAAIVAGWLALCFVSLSIAGSGRSAPDANGLRAYAVLQHTSMGWAVLVHNRSSRPWTRVELELDGAAARPIARVGPDEKLVLGPSQFQLGVAPLGATHRARQIKVSTEQGRVVIPLDAESSAH